MSFYQTIAEQMLPTEKKMIFSRKSLPSEVQQKIFLSRHIYTYISHTYSPIPHTYRLMLLFYSFLPYICSANQNCFVIRMESSWFSPCRLSKNQIKLFSIKATKKNPIRLLRLLSCLFSVLHLVFLLNNFFFRAESSFSPKKSYLCASIQDEKFMKEILISQIIHSSQLLLGFSQISYNLNTQCYLFATSL